ncbi:MAG: RNA-binding protein [Bacteriovoracaceae bacterium]|nr:RNA-binding protein [Bacteriovoracaceae bacterium]
MKTPFAVAKKNANIPTLYLGNLPYHLKEEGILQLFKNIGKVTYVYVVKDKRTKKSKGIAFVQLSKKEEFEKALRVLNGKDYDGRSLKVSQAIENESMPFKPIPSEKKKEKEIISIPKKKRVKKGLASLLERKNS